MRIDKKSFNTFVQRLEIRPAWGATADSNGLASSLDLSGFESRSLFQLLASPKFPPRKGEA